MRRLIILLTLCGWSYALTEQDMKVAFFKAIVKCGKDNPVDVTEIMQMKQMIVPKKTETKCLLACAYKSIELMTKDGLYNLEQVYKISGTMNDEKRAEITRKIADICVQINEAVVSDGEKGCERAALIFKCTIENAAKFGLKID